MTSAAELAAQQRITEGFIAIDETSVVLIPQTETITPNGGRRLTEDTPRDAQPFKVIPMTFDQRPTVTAGGKERLIDYTLLGTVDSVVEINDIWFLDDQPESYYLVVAITDGHGYERKVLCERHLMKDGLQVVE